MITQSELKAAIYYCPKTGKFIRKTALCNRVKIGDTAGTIDERGYIRIRINGGRPIRAHRLAWLYVYGYFPKFIDHINGDCSDNRISNLREVTKKQNCENQKLRVTNKTGVRGVYWNKLEEKYKAQVGHHGKIYHLGTYSFIEDAKNAVRKFRNIHFTHDKTIYSA